MPLFKFRNKGGTAQGHVVETNPNVARPRLSAPPGIGSRARGTVSAPPTGNTSKPQTTRPYVVPFAARAREAAKIRPMLGKPVSSGNHLQGNSGYDEARS